MCSICSVAFKKKKLYVLTNTTQRKSTKQAHKSLILFQADIQTFPSETLLLTCNCIDVKWIILHLPSYLTHFFLKCLLEYWWHLKSPPQPEKGLNALFVSLLLV